MSERTVVLVDDDVSFLENIKDGLKYAIKDLKLITHTNAEDACESFEKNDVSLLVTDQQLPGMSGIELINFVDKEYPTVPVILMTAYGSPKLKNNATDTGAIRFFDKPVDLKEMIKEIEQALKLSGEDLTSIKKMSLATVLELLGMEKKTASIVVKDRESNRSGRIWFNNGELIDSEIDDLEGIEAVFEMLPFGDVDIVVREREHNRVTISGVSLEYVLLEGMKRLDEKEVEKENETKDEVSKFDKAVELLKKEIGETLLASGIFTIEDSKTITSYKSSAKTAELFNEMSKNINKYLKKMKLPSIGKYYILDLANSKTLIIVTFNKYRWAILLDSRKLKLGLLLNLVLPDIIGMFQ